MSDIKNPVLFSVIANAVGFAYIWAIDPDRIELQDDGKRMVQLSEDGSEMEIINKITSNVYEHLIDGNFVEEQPGEWDE